MQKFFQVISAMKQSLLRLKLDYVDLLLIHSPGLPEGYKFAPIKTSQQEALEATFPKSPEDLKEARIAMWLALEELKSRGLARNIGVSNFNRFHLEQLINDPR